MYATTFLIAEWPCPWKHAPRGSRHLVGVAARVLWGRDFCPRSSSERLGSQREGGVGVGKRT